MSCVDCMGSCEVIRNCRRCQEAEAASTVHRLTCRIVELEAVLREAIDHICGDTDDERVVLRRARAALTKGSTDGR